MLKSGDLPEGHAQLLEAAKNASKNAYAPYSRFYVGAAILLENGEIFTGSNQENGSYPIGSCAERVALNYVMSHDPNSIIECIAVYATTPKFELRNPVSPCGMCRQALLEAETNQVKPIEILLANDSDKVYKVHCIADLLPFAFESHQLKSQ